MDIKLNETVLKSSEALNRNDAEGALGLLLPVGDVPSHEVQFNLALTWIRLGKPARASAYIERALQLKPRDEKALLTQDLVNRELQRPLDTDLILLNLHSVTRYASDLDGLVLFSFLLFITVILEWVRMKVPFLIRFLVLLATIGSFLLYGGLLWMESRDLAIVTSEQTQILQGPSLTFPEGTSLSPGTLVEILAQEPGWVRARRSTELDGWIPKEKLVPLFSNSPSP